MCVYHIVASTSTHSNNKQMSNKHDHFTDFQDFNIFAFKNGNTKRHELRKTQNFSLLCHRYFTMNYINYSQLFCNYISSDFFA